MSSPSDWMDSPLQETIQEATTTGADLPPHPNTSKSKRKPSDAWNHFTKQPDDPSRAACHYCGTSIKCSSGTTGMKTHLTRCSKYPDSDKNKKQKKDDSLSQVAEGQVGSDVVSSPMVFIFDQDICRKELVRLFIAAELPFRFVEHHAFRKFLSVLQPRFVVPSRSTLRRDIEAMFIQEQMRLKAFMSKHCVRVCLTTDTWTSVQNFCYMSLTAHFIDNDWKLQKKVLNFRRVTGHSGEIIASNVESCLNEWDLGQVLTVTVDNATSNDTAISNLKKSFLSLDKVILKGGHLHTRCCAHILNLIVKEGLSDLNDSILRIRSAVRYVRASTTRYIRFMTCAEEAKISYKGVVNVDTETRWNSTYTMLEAALKYQRAFDLYEVRDAKFKSEMKKEKGKGAPTVEDWDHARSVLPFLKIFYSATMRISGSYYVTNNKYMKEVFSIGRQIRLYEVDPDPSISLMASKMKKKYEKYWGDPNKINLLLLIAVVLDPQNNIGYVSFFLKYLYGEEKGIALKAKLMSCLKSLYELYEGKEAGPQNAQQPVQMDEDDEEIEEDIYSMNFFVEETGSQVDASSSELDRYLKEDREKFKIDFDILNWWNVNSTRLPILSRLARDVLSIPVSTVASESAFSTGGRVLSDERSSLTPQMVEMLICTQDWFKETSFSMLSNEDLEELDRFHRELVQQERGANSETNIFEDNDNL